MIESYVKYVYGGWSMGTLEEQRIRELIGAFGSAAGEDEAFLQGLAAGLFASPEIGEEFLFYAETGNFSCKAKVEGYTVVDIMVWQIDHFKAEMDRGRTDMKNNGSKMVLRAFDTMLKMKDAPERYKRLMQSETGTDYPDKY